MTRKAAKRKPKSPEDIAAAKLESRRQAMEAVNLHPDAAGLDQQQDIEIVRTGEARDDDKRAGHDTARRTDAFEALKRGMAKGCYDAARRFEMDLLIRLGLSEGMAGTQRIDCSAGHTTDLMLTAGLMVDKVKDRLAPRDYWLLHELIAPPVDRGTWRDHVRYITGERHTEGQAAAVRLATVNLRDAYAMIERKVAA